MATSSTSLRAAPNSEYLEQLWLLLKRRETRHLGIYMRVLASRNRSTQRSILAKNGPVLSLTSYGKRIQSVHYTIESIAAGTQLPSRLILWLDDEQAYRNLPAPLKRLAVRGLEIRLTANLGPHTKYYPTLEQISEHNLPLVTADDDVLYTRHWLEGLVEAYGQEPGVLHCYRAHQMRISDGRIAPYTHWSSCRSSRPSFLHFATAVSGNILPPRLLQVLREAGTSFRLLCPKADDIWIHMNSLRAGIQTRQLGAWQRNFPLLPGTQDVMLSQANIGSAQNDVQIAKTYAEDELALLRRAADNDPAIG